MYRLLQSRVFSSAALAKLNQQTRSIHNLSLAPLHQVLHTTNESTPRLQGLRLHDHHAYQTANQNTTTHGATHNISLIALHQTMRQQNNPAPQLQGLRLHDHHGCQTQSTVSEVQKSNMSTSVKESKIARELREARARAAAMGREMDFREAHGLTQTSRNFGAVPWEAPIITANKTQVILSNTVASAAKPKEKIHGTEAKSNAVVRRGINPILTRVGVETANLCAADLDNIYNL